MRSGHSKGIPFREFNLLAGFTGKVETGKSTLATKLAQQLARKHGAIILAQDINWSLKETLPDGSKHVIIRSGDTMEAWEILRKGGKFDILTVQTLYIDEIIELAYRYQIVRMGGQISAGGYDSNDWRTVDQTRKIPPAVVFIDEIANAEDSHPKHLSPLCLDLISQRRHRHTGLIWTAQSPHMAHRQFLAQATDMYLFTVTDSIDLNRLRIGLSSDRALTDKLPTLAPHHYIHLRPNAGSGTWGSVDFQGKRENNP